MKIHVRGLSFKLTDAIIRHAESRIATALGAAHDRVSSVIARLDDINGDHGGEDKSCRIVVCLNASGAVVAESVDRDLYAAVDRAAAKLRGAIARRLGRRRASRREHTYRLPQAL